MTPKRVDPSANRRGFNAVVVIALVWLVGFSLWFHHFDIPNNHVPRWQFWISIPFDLLDFIDPPESPSTPWSWFFLLQRIPFLLIATIIWLGAWGSGSLILRALGLSLPSCERLFFAICIGLSLVALEMLLLGLCGFMSSWPLLLVLAVPVVVELLQRAQSQSATHGQWSQSPDAKIRWSRFGGLVFFSLLIFVVCELNGAMSPQTDFDVVEYHLGGPKEWFQQGRITRLPHNVYTSFPFLAEMLVLAGMVIHGDWQWGALAGQAVIAGFAPLTALGLFAAGRRWFTDHAGWLAALVYLTSPWTYRISIIAYVEGGLSCYLFAAIYATLLLREKPHDPNPEQSTRLKLAFLAGMLAGSSMACKYTGLVMVIVPCGLLALGSVIRPFDRTAIRSCVAVGLLFSSGMLTTIGPWLVKNAIQTGNPVYPLAVRYFGGTDRTEELDLKWRKAHAARSYPTWNDRLYDLGLKLADVTAVNDWHSPLMFGLAPLSLIWVLRRRPPTASEDPRQATQRSLLGIVWAYVIWQFLVWFCLTHHIDRFYVPMFSAVALLAGVGACWWQSSIAAQASTFNLSPGRWCTIAIVIASILYNADLMMHVNIGGFNAGRMDLNYARQVAEQVTSPRVAWWNKEIESGHQPANSKVLCVGEAALFYARYPYLYNTVFDHSIFEQICGDPQSDQKRLRSAEVIRHEFQRLGITHVEVDWAMILMYREPFNYGYTDFVSPARFVELQQMGVLAPPVELPAEISLAPLDEKRRERLSELKWDASLIRNVADQPAYITTQVFPVIETAGQR